MFVYEQLETRNSKYKLFFLHGSTMTKETYWCSIDL